MSVLIFLIASVLPSEVVGGGGGGLGVDVEVEVEGRWDGEVREEGEEEIVRQSACVLATSQLLHRGWVLGTFVTANGGLLFSNLAASVATLGGSCRGAEQRLHLAAAAVGGAARAGKVVARCKPCGGKVADSGGSRWLWDGWGKAEKGAGSLEAGERRIWESSSISVAVWGGWVVRVRGGRWGWMRRLLKLRVAIVSFFSRPFLGYVDE